MAVEELIRNKKYKIRVPTGYNGTKRTTHVETVYGTRREANIREREIKLSLTNDTYIKKKNITVGLYIDEWLKSKKDKIAPKTYKGYELYAKNIKEVLGTVKLAKLTPKMLEDFYSWLKSKKNYAPKTIRHHQTLMNVLLNTAVKWEYISSNPNEKTEKVKVVKKEIECYSPEEVTILVSALDKECLKYRVLILLALDTGCRRGELTGLEWDDIDLETGLVRINKTTQYITGMGIFEKTPKTESSNRSIYIAPSTLKVLKLYRVEQDKLKLRLGSKWENSKKVFTNNTGGFIHPNTPSTIFDNIIKRHNLRRINFHALRHTSISLQISTGIQTQIISKRAGHSNLSTTHSIYSHFFENSFKEVAQKMDAFIHAPTENIL